MSHEQGYKLHAITLAQQGGEGGHQDGTEGGQGHGGGGGRGGRGRGRGRGRATIAEMDD